MVLLLRMPCTIPLPLDLGPGRPLRVRAVVVVRGLSSANTEQRRRRLHYLALDRQIVDCTTAWQALGVASEASEVDEGKGKVRDVDAGA